MSEDPFPVKPDTNEYQALSFLVAHRGYGFTPNVIAEQTEIGESNVSNTLERLFEKDLVERSDGSYYVPPEDAEALKKRLESLDAAVKLFENAPADAYSEDGWENEVTSLDRSEDW